MKFRGLAVATILSACAQSAAPAGGGDPVAPADRPPVTYHKNGTVETGDLRFASVVEFQQSQDFIEHGRRCASDNTIQNSRAAATDCSFTSTSIKPEYSPDSVFTIPIVFHVVQKTDGTGNVPEDLIHSQIEILNEDFDALAGTPGAGGTAGKIRFVLASTDPNGNPTSGIEYVTNDSFFVDPGSGLSPMKNQLHWDTAHYFNVYTNDANGALGYATFPSESAGDAEDGVVLLYTSVGRDAPQGGIYNQGRTATHEIGHYLGLFHTFQSGCGSAGAPYTSGDLIKETVAHTQPDFNCTAGASSCGGGNLPIENYMNYTPDTCMTKFSPEQVNRMRCSIVNYRSALVSIDTGTNTAPAANFTSTANNLAVTFADTSTDSDGTIASRAWTFGDGGTSTAASPSHTYAAAGTFTVTLKVTDNDGATDTHSASITVTAGGGGTGGQLTSGVPVPNQAGATGSQLQFFIDVPAGATSLSIQISGGTGDADLYVRKGSAPTTTQYDARPYLTGNNETVLIQNPAQARYFVMLRGYTAFTGVTLVATVATGGGGGGFEDVESNLSAATGASKQFSVAVPAGAHNLKFTIAGGTGDADLYVRKGAAPTTSTYDFRPYLDGNAETVEIATPATATYFVMVRAYRAYAGVTLTVTYN
ncbi:MAG: pre-peptidase C-terminal domain-containing protein [Kofleriaceae bacterium]